MAIYNEKMSLLAIANYNLGSQYEFLEEFPDSIARYELALTIVSLSDDASPLAAEFQQSLKQVRSRYAAFKMKRPDRTFTNLSKAKPTDDYEDTCEIYGFSNDKNAPVGGAMNKGKKRRGSSSRPYSAHVAKRQEEAKH